MPSFKDTATAEGAAAAVEVETLAAEIGEVYYIEKDAKEEKERLKGALFQAITEAFAAEELAQKTVQVPEDVAASDADDFVLKYNPGWTIVPDQEWDPHERKILIEEDPNFKQDSIVVAIEGGVTDHKDPKKSHPGYKITKTVRNGSAMIDEVRLRNVEPGLFDAVMAPRGYDWISDMLYHQNVEPDELDEAINDFLPEDWPLEMRTDLTDEEREAIKPYTYEGPKSLALNVSYAKKSDF